MTKLLLPSFAKINRYLRVVGKRTDGYHEIQTIFQTVSLADQINFDLRCGTKDISLSCEDARVPTDETNIIIRAARLLQNDFDVKDGADVGLNKNIPTMGGLGGGSSNAAVALLAFSHLWNLRPSKEKLLEIAARLGADVPFFLYGGTALGTGTGTTIKPLEDAPEQFLLIVGGNEFVETQNAYAGLAAPHLTNLFSDNNLTISCDGESIDNLINTAHNDFEEVVFRSNPSIEKAKKTLLKNGARWAMMSGSGASVVGVFDSFKERRNATQICQTNDWRSFEVETVSRREYLKSLSPVRYLIESFDG